MRSTFFALGIGLLLLTSCSHKFFIVRHAEKMDAGTMMSGDVSLTSAGMARAEALKERLQKEKIGLIYSTNTIRTKSTAQPTADYFRIPVHLYAPRPDSLFIDSLRSVRKNTLIVGHSNTVDEIVNMLCKRREIAGDLKDDEYDNLFIVILKGKKAILRREKYGNSR